MRKIPVHLRVAQSVRGHVYFPRCQSCNKLDLPPPDSKGATKSRYKAFDLEKLLGSCYFSLMAVKLSK